MFFTAAKKGMLEVTWRLLQEDDGIREAILIKMRLAEVYMAKDAGNKLEISRLSTTTFARLVYPLETVLETWTPSPPSWERHIRDWESVATKEMDVLMEELASVNNSSERQFIRTSDMMEN